MSRKEQPAEIAEQVAELEALAEQAEPEQEYIPKDEPEPPGGQPGETAEILAPILQITFGVVAARRGPHWALTNEEAAELGKAYGAVLDKHFPDAANKFGVELTAVLVTLAAFGPRIIEDKRKAAEAEAARAAETKQEQAQDLQPGGVDGNSSE